MHYICILPNQNKTTKYAIIQMMLTKNETKRNKTKHAKCTYNNNNNNRTKFAYSKRIWTENANSARESKGKRVT